MKIQPKIIPIMQSRDPEREKELYKRKISPLYNSYRRLLKVFKAFAKAFKRI